MLNVTLGRPSAAPRELRIVSIKAAVVLDLRAAERTSSPYIQPLPVNAAGETFQGIFCHFANIAVIVIGALYGFNKVELRQPGARRQEIGRASCRERV